MTIESYLLLSTVKKVKTKETSMMQELYPIGINIFDNPKWFLN